MKKCLTLLLAFFLTALAAGCGKREEQTPAVSYEVTSLPISLGELIQGEVILTQDAVYHLEENDGYRCIVKRTFGELADSPEATGKTVIVFTDGEMPETFQRTEVHIRHNIFYYSAHLGDLSGSVLNLLRLGYGALGDLLDSTAYIIRGIAALSRHLVQAVALLIEMIRRCFQLAHNRSHSLEQTVYRSRHIANLVRAVENLLVYLYIQVSARTMDFARLVAEIRLRRTDTISKTIAIATKLRTFTLINASIAVSG